MNNFDGSSFTIGIYADKDNAVTMSKIISALGIVDLHFANKIFTATTASEMPQLMNFDKPVEQVICQAQCMLCSDGRRDRISDTQRDYR